jgi:hypothetical protein
VRELVVELQPLGIDIPSPDRAEGDEVPLAIAKPRTGVGPRERVGDGQRGVLVGNRRETLQNVHPAPSIDGNG